MKAKFAEKILRAIFIFVFFVGTVWVPGVSVGASTALTTGIGLRDGYQEPGDPELTLEKSASPAIYSEVDDIINYSYLLTNTGTGTLTGPFSVTDDKTTATCPGNVIPASLNGTVLFDHFENATLAEYTNGIPAYVSGPSGFGQGVDMSSGAWMRYAVPGWYQWSNNYDPTGKAGSVDFWVYPKRYDMGLINLNWHSTQTPPADGHILHMDLDVNGKLYVGTWSAITSPTLTPLPAGNTTIPLNQWTHVAYSWGTDGTRTSVNGVQDSFSPDNLYPALNSTVYVYAPNWGYPDVGYIDELRITDNSQTDFGTLSLALTETTTCIASYTITQSDIANGSVTNTAQAHGFSDALPIDSNQDTAVVQNPRLTLEKSASPAIYGEVGDIINYSYLLTNTGTAALAGPFTVTDDKTTATCPGNVTPVSLNDTVLFDHFENATQAEYISGAPNYVGGPSGFGQGIDTSSGAWLRYAVPGWYQWSSNYNPAGKSGSIDFWIYPKRYDVGLINLNWHSTQTPPADGHILHLDLDANGKLSSGTWSAISSPALTPLPAGNAVIPINQWTHVAFTWGADGTRTYVNGVQDAFTPDNFYPALNNNNNNYLYVPNWGTPEIGYLDELRITSSSQTDFGAPSLAPTETTTCFGLYTIAQSDTDNGSVTNTAQAHAFFGSMPIDSNQDIATVTVSQPPTPHMDVFYKENRIRAYDWPFGTHLILEIDDPTTPASPDYSTATDVNGYADWDPHPPVGVFDLNELFEIQPGMIVTISGASITKQLVISNLTITSIDQTTDIITGRTEPNQALWMWYNTSIETCCRGFQADENGVWMVDYSELGPNGEPVENIGPGSRGTINANDDDGDNTSLNWSIPQPHIVANAQANWVNAREWEFGTTVYLSINGIDRGSAVMTNPAPWNPSVAYAAFNLGGYDVQVGDVIRVEGSDITKELTVSPLQVTTVDVAADTVSGVSTGGAYVVVTACLPNGGCVDGSATADGSSGVWMVDFHENADLVAGSNGWVQEWDVDVDATEDGWGFSACYMLTTSVNSASGGSITTNPLPNCPTDSGKYRDGTHVTLTANSAAGWAFTGWTGSASGTTNPILVTMGGDRTVTASFTDGCSNVTEIPRAECEALIALYNSTNGPGWTDHTDWLITNTPCSWYGVSCITWPYGTYVFYLFLGSNQLIGSIPAELGNLTRLLTLQLSGNQLSGNIPPELGNMSDLAYLFLTNNRLSGEIPAEIGDLSNLYTLNLGYNQLSGSIPAEIGNLSSLRNLSFNVNQLSGNIPVEIGSLLNLQDLEIGYNNLSGSIPVEIGNLSNLKYLNLNYNQLSGTIPIEIGNFSNLQQLDLGRNQLSGNIPNGIGNLLDLRTLDLSNNLLTGSIPPTVGDMTQLTYITIAGNKLSGNIPPDLGNLTLLGALGLEGNQLTGNIPEEFGNLIALNILYLDHNQLSGDFPASITNLVHLQTLSFDCGLTSSDPDVIAFLNSLVPDWQSRCIRVISGNTGVGEATLSYTDGTPKAVIADGTGNYTIEVRYDWSGSVSPSKTGYSFSPESRTYTNVTADMSNEDYSAALLPYACSNVTEIQQAECEALEALYNSTDGDSWINQTDWLMTNTPCSWYGVACSGGHIYGIDLRANQLSGSIPPEMGNLTQLTRLALSQNQLSGSIPPQLGNLSQLISLYLFDNQLTGNIPPELGNLAQLEVLSLSDNQFSGSIPPELGNLTQLVGLNISYNQLSGNIPVELGNLTQLMSLFLGANQLSGSIPAELGNLTHLSHLLLYNNQLTGSIPNGLGNLTILRQLYLDQNQLSGSIPVQLGNLTQLNHLYLSNNQLSGSIPVQLGNLTQLNYLNLSNNQLSGGIPVQLGNLTQLNYLYLNNNQLSGEFPNSITNLVNLTNLTFDCSLTSTDPVVITFISNLVPDWQSRCIRIISGNAGVGEATLSYTNGTPKTVTADGTGNYAIEVPYNWSGAITPSKTGYAFTPPNHVYVNVVAHQTNQDYIANAYPVPFNKLSPTTGATNLPTSPTLSWEASRGATSYEYCISPTVVTCTNWVNTGTIRSITLSDLSSSTTYYWQVRAINDHGLTYADGSESAHWSFTTGATPPAFNKANPGDGAANRSTSVAVYWYNSPGAGSYEYCYDTTDDGQCSSWVNTGLVRNATISGLTPSTTYYWQARANNQYGSTYANAGAYWSFTTASLPGAFGKSSPANGVTIAGDALLTWEASNGAVSYEYCYDTTDDGQCSSWVSTGTTRSIVLSGLPANTTYYWQVRAQNAMGSTYANGSESSHWSFTQSLLNHFSKANPGNGSMGRSTTLTLYWYYSAGATSYDYCYDLSNDGQCSTWVSTGLTRNVTLSGLIPNKTYYWQVRSNNGYGSVYANGAANAFWSFTTGALPGSFNKSTPSNGVAITSDPVLTWGASSNATSYEYCYDTTNDGLCSTWVSTGMVRSVTLIELNPSTTYYWQVRAKNSIGTTYANALETAFWALTTSQPGVFNKANPGNGAINRPTTLTLYWYGSGGATSYEYCYDTTDNGQCSTWVNTGMTRNVTLSGLDPNTTYYWQVRAVNVFGMTYANSNTFWSFTTTP